MDPKSTEKGGSMIRTLGRLAVCPALRLLRLGRFSAPLASGSIVFSASIFPMGAALRPGPGATQREVRVKGSSTSGSKYNVIENKAENFLAQTRQNPQPIRSG